MNRYSVKIDEGLIKSFIKIQKNVNRIYGCNSEVFDTMGNLIQDLYEETAANMDMNKLNVAIHDDFLNGMRSMIGYDPVRKMGEKLSEVVRDYAAQAEQPHQLSKIDLSPIFISEFISSCLFKDSINIAYKMTWKESDQAGDEFNGLESGFSDIEELEHDICECINDPKYFREKFTDWPLKKKIRYCKINQILCFLCACFIQPYIQENIGLPVIAHKISNVKKMPEAGSDVLFKLTENTEAIVLENSISYYRIAFIDGDGIKREGYVAKKNVRLLNA